MPNAKGRDETPRTSWWVPLFAVISLMGMVVAIFVAAFFRGREVELTRNLLDARIEVRDQSIELTHLREAFTIMNGPESLYVPFMTAGAQGRVFVNASLGVVLSASKLPALPVGKAYELWLVPREGRPLPAGSFSQPAGGPALYTWHGVIDVPNTGSVVLTVENAGGASQPTLPAVITVGIPKTK